MSRKRELLLMAICFLLAGVMAFVVSAIANASETPMAKTPDLFDSGLPRSETALLSQMYGDAAKRLKKIVLNPPGRTDKAKAFRQGRAAELVSQVEQIRIKLRRQAGLWVGQNVPKAYRDGKLRADQQAVAAGVRPQDGNLPGSFSVIDQHAVLVFARDTLADLSRAADSMADRAAGTLRKTAQLGLSENHINKILAGGIIDGAPREAIRALRKELQAVHGDKVQVTDKNGRTMEFDVGYYAEMVARTKTREATVQGRHQRLRDLGLDLVMIIGLKSNNFCSAFLDQVFSLSGQSDKYPPYSALPDGGPPFHPHCSKSTRPFVEALASDAQLDRAEGLEDAQKLLGTDASEAQRRFKDLQIAQQQTGRHATTESSVFG